MATRKDQAYNSSLGVVAKRFQEIVLSSSLERQAFLNELNDSPLSKDGILIAGLGNPGSKYANNRHNIGFLIVDRLCDFLGITMEQIPRFRAACATIPTHHIHIIQPQTFMNLSGEAIVEIMRFFKLQQLLVVHDELDIPFGAIRYKFGGSSGGHNGLKSIDLMLQSNAYARLRFGIAESSTPQIDSTIPKSNLTKQNVISFVLGDFPNDHKDELNTLINHSVRSLLFFLQTRDFKAMQNFFTLSKSKLCPFKAQNNTRDGV